MDYLRARSAQADTKQRLAVGIADLDAVVVVVTFNGERRYEELALRFRTPERRIIVRELDTIIIVDAVGSQIPMEIIARHSRLSGEKKWPQEQPSWSASEM